MTWFSTSTSTTGGFGGWSAQQQARSQLYGHVELTLQPMVNAADVLSFAQKSAAALWPEMMGVGLRALAPLIASVAREVNVRRSPCQVRIVRRGDRQHIEPILPTPPVDGEWPAEAEVVATERHRIGDG